MSLHKRNTIANFQANKARLVAFDSWPQHPLPPELNAILGANS